MIGTLNVSIIAHVRRYGTLQLLLCSGDPLLYLFDVIVDLRPCRTFLRAMIGTLNVLTVVRDQARGS